ncbi:hypothetical protein GCM10010402_14140 [Actinomadura luteofluorescens]
MSAGEADEGGVGGQVAGVGKAVKSPISRRMREAVLIPKPGIGFVIGFASRA